MSSSQWVLQWRFHCIIIIIIISIIISIIIIIIIRSGVRWQDFVVSIHWLLDNHPSGQEQFLWDLAELVYQQGFKWKDYYGGSGFPNDSVSSMNLMNHGVNNGMAIKSGGVWFRQSHSQSDADSSYQRMKVIDQYHGQASGMFTCDEHLAGLMPSRGVVSY